MWRLWSDKISAALRSAPKERGGVIDFAYCPDFVSILAAVQFPPSGNGNPLRKVDMLPIPPCLRGRTKWSNHKAHGKTVAEEEQGGDDIPQDLTETWALSEWAIDCCLLIVPRSCRTMAGSVQRELLLPFPTAQKQAAAAASRVASMLHYLERRGGGADCQ